MAELIESNEIMLHVFAGLAEMQTTTIQLVMVVFYLLIVDGSSRRIKQYQWAITNRYYSLFWNCCFAVYEHNVK